MVAEDGEDIFKEYMMNQNKAKMILNGDDGNERIPNLVSIIMPSYNTAQYIEKTIKSVLDQTYTNWELIIVDDCSTDNTDEVVKNYLTDKRIKYLKMNKILALQLAGIEP